MVKPLLRKHITTVIEDSAMTCEELSVICGVGASTLRAMCNGNIKEPNVFKLQALCACLGYKMSDFFKQYEIIYGDML